MKDLIGERSFDVLLIGTGLPMLLHGLSLAEAGQRVVFVDSSNSPGGSWKTFDMFGHAGIEAGVHFVENRTTTNATFKALLPEDQLTPKEADFGLVRGWRFPMPLSRILLYSVIGAKSLLRGQTDKARHSFRNMRLSVQNVRQPILYPRAGMSSVHAAILNRLAKAQATVVLGTTVNDLEMSGGGVTANTDSADIHAERVVMSSRAHAPINGSAPFADCTERFTVFNQLLYTKGDAPLFGGYVEIMGDQSIKRIRDTGQLSHPPVLLPNAVLTVQLRAKAKDQSAETTMADLVRLGLLTEQCELIDSATSNVTVETLTDAAIEQWTRSYPDQLTVLRTVDLSDQSHDITHWSKLGKATNLTV